MCGCAAGAAGPDAGCEHRSTAAQARGRAQAELGRGAGTAQAGHHAHAGHGPQ